MTPDKRLRETLFKENGVVPGKISDDEREQIWRMIAKDKARVRRMKWATIISWLLVLLPCLIGPVMIALGISLRLEPIGGAILMFLFYAMKPVAIICTVSYFIRSRSLSSRETQARLANLEEQLRLVLQSEEMKPPQ